MIDITTFFAAQDRVQIYRPGVCTEHGTCILYWMQRAQRGQENSALNAAITLGNALDLPVVVLFVVTSYPSANLRHYQFMLEGIAVVARQLQLRGTPLVIRQGAPAEIVVQMAQELSAAAVISDESELRTPRSWRQTVKERLNMPFACVDADVVVPSKHFAKEEWAARTLRPKIQRLLPHYLSPLIDQEPRHRLSQAPCDPGQEPLAYLATLPLDRSVPPSTLFRGGQDEGRRRLQRFIDERLMSYDQTRNHPELSGTSELSAYLHFGHISVQQSAWQVEQHLFPATGSSAIDPNGARAAYQEELIVRRELAINFAWHNPQYDTLAGCPSWGQETLRKHAHDPRPWLYHRNTLEEGKTHDELWNACQREMLVTGRMHGYMRMYWAKKLLEWTATPEEAFDDAVYLNDKYELDGRDANGYMGIAWAIGGKHDRPWGPERPIFGLIRYMSLAGMQRKIDTRAYIFQWRPERREHS